MDFEALQLSNEYYVDKTMFIPYVEANRFVFLIRPRRFGKSLFLSTLESYYDINKKDRFNDFYRDTWILENPTEERAKYMILRFNFSGITKEKDLVQKDFNNYCVKVIDHFVTVYHEYIPKEIIYQVESDVYAHEKLHTLTVKMTNTKVKIYVMIDEYDNFANSLLMEHGAVEYKKTNKRSGLFQAIFYQSKACCNW